MVVGRSACTHACRKFRDRVGQCAWVDWPSESFVGKDQDRQVRGLSVGGLDKKHLSLYITVSQADRESSLINSVKSIV